MRRHIDPHIPTAPASPRRRLARVATLLVAGTLAVTACGDDSVEPSGATPDPGAPSTTQAPADTIPPADQYDHPTGADEVVIEIAYEGGFVPVDRVFSDLPVLVVTGDGTRYVQGPQIEIYPGPLLPNVQVADLGEDGIQELLALADELGLLADREYESPINIADAPDTVVTIAVGDATYVHRAYALGLDEDGGTPAADDPRAQLAEFVDRASELAADVPEGGEQAFEPEAFLVRSFPIDDLTEFEIEPTVVDWPTDVTAVLADASDCVEIPAADVADLFSDANQLTFFAEDGVTYQLAVKPLLPGDAC